MILAVVLAVLLVGIALIVLFFLIKRYLISFQSSRRTFRRKALKDIDDGAADGDIGTNLFSFSLLTTAFIFLLGIF